MNYTVQATLDRVKGNKHYSKMLENDGFHVLAQAQSRFDMLSNIYHGFGIKRVVTDKEIYYDVTEGIGSYDKYIIHIMLSEI